MSSTTTYDPSGIRTITFDAIVSLGLPAILSLLVQRIKAADFTSYIPITNTDSGETYLIPVGPGEWRSLLLCYAAWSANAVGTYHIDFDRGHAVKCRLIFGTPALAALFAMTQLMGQDITPTADMSLAVQLSLVFLTEAYRGGDIGNAFGDPVSGADD